MEITAKTVLAQHPPNNPMQPIHVDSTGVRRFKKNRVVDFLMEVVRGEGKDINDLRRMGFPDDDMMQFCQLIEYSVSGYGDLSFVSDESRKQADEAAEKVC